MEDFRSVDTADIVKAYLDQLMGFFKFRFTVSNQLYVKEYLRST